MCAIAQHFGRPGTPTDHAWIESLFSHIKADWPHLDAIVDPAVLRAELAEVRIEYNTIRLDAGIGYVTPDDEHEGRGPQIRRALWCGIPGLLETVSFDTHSLSAGPDLLPHAVRNVPGHIS